MSSIKPRWNRGFVVTSLLSTLAACGGHKDKTTATTPPVVATPAQEDKFGTVFGIAFRVAANSDPYNPSDGDIVAISLTTEPEQIN